MVSADAPRGRRRRRRPTGSPPHPRSGPPRRLLDAAGLLRLGRLRAVPGGTVASAIALAASASASALTLADTPRPSMTASAIRDVMSRIARMASSLPGIG